MQNYATNIAEGFAADVIGIFFEEAVSDAITNNNYEGEVQNKLSKLHILTFGKLALHNYSEAPIASPDNPQESVGELITNQEKMYYFKIGSVARFQSWIKNPENTVISDEAGLLKEAVDAYVLGLWGDAGAGNWDGTDYVTGTVTVDVTTGAVTGSGTTFTSGMVGKPFKAVGHTKWYRVKSYASGTSIVIENDSDDDVSAYDGGAIAGGTAYVIQANTAIQITKSNIYERLVALKTKLNKNKIPKSDRWIVLPSDLSALLLQAPEFIPAVQPAYENVVLNGLLGKVAGFTVYENEQVAGDATNGYRVLAGHKSAITFALGFTETGIEDLKGDFGKAYKGLTVYGAKVLDERRKALAQGYWKL